MKYATLLIAVFVCAACQEGSTKLDVKKEKNNVPSLVIQKGHSQEIWNAVFSPNDAILATLSNDKTIKFWDTNTGRLMKNVITTEEPEKEMYFSSDGNYFIYSDVETKPSSLSRCYVLHVLNIGTLNEIQTIRPHSIIRNYREGEVVAIDVDSLTGKKIEITADEWDPEGLALEVEFSNNNSRKSGDDVGYLETYILIPNSHKILTMGAAINSGVDRELRMWDMTTGKNIGRMPLGNGDGKIGLNTSYQFGDSVNNLQCLIGFENEILVFDLDKMKLKTNFHVAAKEILDYDLATKIAIIIPTSGKEYQLLELDVAKNILKKTIPLSGDADQFFNKLCVRGQFSALHRKSSEMIEVLSNNDFKNLGSVQNPLIKNVRSIHLSESGKYLETDGSIWRIPEGRLLSKIEYYSPEIREAVYIGENRISITKSNVYQELLVNDMIEINTIDLGQHPHIIKPKVASDPVRCAAIKDDSLMIWSIDEKKPIHTFPVAKDKEIFAVSADQAGDRVCYMTSNSGEYCLELIETDSGKRRSITCGPLELKKLAVNPKGDSAVLTHAEAIALYDLNNGGKICTIQYPVYGYYASDISKIGYNRDGSQVVLLEDLGNAPITVRDSHNLNELLKMQGDAMQNCCVFSPDAQKLLTGDCEGRIILWDLQTGARLKTVQANGAVTSIDLNPDGSKALALTDRDQALTVWDLQSEKPIIHYTVLEDDDFIAYTDAGYYLSSLEGSDCIRWFFDGPQIADFSQYSKVFACNSLSELFTKSNQPTVKIDPPPIVQLTNAYETIESTSNSFQVKFKVFDKNAIDNVRIFANGKFIKELPVNSNEMLFDESIQIQNGVNRITVIAYNKSGLSSYPVYLDVLGRISETKKTTVHILTAGISKYPNLPGELQLDYAHKDAIDLIKAFERQKPDMVDDIKTYELTNEKATLSNIQDALNKLKEAMETDLAIVFLSGHGVIDDQNGKYYFLTANSALDSIQKEGLDWQVFNESLKSIKARTILLLDTCHSGALNNEVFVPSDQMIKSILNDQRSGVIVFSAAKSRQESLESPEIEHGFFTYAMLEALGGIQADLKGQPGLILDANNDSFVEFSEFTHYVTERVRFMTGGFHTPRVVRQEISGDFPIAKIVS